MVFLSTLYNNQCQFNILVRLSLEHIGGPFHPLNCQMNKIERKFCDNWPILLTISYLKISQNILQVNFQIQSVDRQSQQEKWYPDLPTFQTSILQKTTFSLCVYYIILKVIRWIIGLFSLYSKVYILISCLATEVDSHAPSTFSHRYLLMPNNQFVGPVHLC